MTPLKSEAPVNWVLDADIRSFFTEIDREWMVRFLEHRIADKRVLRLIDKWLAAGIIEDGEWSDEGKGCSGACQSPRADRPAPAP